jgi:hypothetical protein
MLCRLALVAAALALAAAPASSQDAGGIGPTSPAPKTALRPSQTIDPTAVRVGRTPAVPPRPAFGGPPRTAGEVRAEQQRITAANPPLPVLSPPPPRSRVDPGQCRISCAQTYYFCAGGDSPGECAPAWAQCRAGCEPAAGWRAPVGLRGGG